MTLPSNIKVSLNEVSQEIDVEEIAGIDISGNPDLKEAIGQALIDFIVQRSESGKDINRSPFKAYKKSYKESDQFEAFAKTNDVNMTLTSNMLSDINVLSTSGNTIKLGFRDKTNNNKAFNHMTGDTVRKREFFGLRDKDVEEVLGAFSEDIDRLKDEPTDDISRFIKTIQEGSLGPRVTSQPGTVTISVQELFDGES